MTQFSPLSFIHASDLHLDELISGLDAVPEKFRDRIIDAPYSATERMFETAILEEVDFILLAGDVLDPQAFEPRAIAFFLEQLQSLNEHDIAVYWIGGNVDSPTRWPDSFKLPQGVHMFSGTELESIAHMRGDEHLCTIIGKSNDGRIRFRPADYQPDQTAPFNIGIGYGPADKELLSQQNINYWALGGEHQRSSLFTTPRVAHYCGSVQGRNPSEEGAHGCTLVQVGEDRTIRTREINTDCLRFQTETIALMRDMTRAEFERLFDDRLTTVLSNAGDQPLLVRFTVEGDGMLIGTEPRTQIVDELTQRLRQQYGGRRPAAWTIAIEFTEGRSFDTEVYEEDTILGDFLRTVRAYQTESEHDLDVSEYLPDRGLAGSLAGAVDITDSQQLDAALRDATSLGIEMLSGGDTK